MLRALTRRTFRLRRWRKTTLLGLAVLMAFVPGLAAGSAAAQATPRAEAIVAVSDSPDPVFTNLNNSATAITQVVEPTDADVSINLPGSVEGYAGQTIWLGTIEVRNAGPATATGLTVTLEFPRGLSPTLGGGACAEASDGLSCSYSWGSLPPGGTSADIIGITAAEAGSYTVRGSVTADQPDPVPSDNSDSTVVTANPADDLSTQIARVGRPGEPWQGPHV